MKNGHELELCLCESAAGEIPCNHGNNFFNCDLALMAKIIFVMMIFNMVKSNF
jgi:hypothetical protein